MTKPDYFETVTIDHDVVLPEYHFHANTDLQLPPELAEFLVTQHGAKRKGAKRETAVKPTVSRVTPAAAAPTKAETPEDKK